MQVLSRIRGLAAAVSQDEPVRKKEAGGGAGSAGRQTLTVNEGSGDLAVGKSAVLLRVSATAPARIRVYSRAAARTADAGRNTGTLPAQGSGCLLEFITTPTLLAADLAPAVTAYNQDGDLQDFVYYLIEPILPAVAAAVTFTYISLEN